MDIDGNIYCPRCMRKLTETDPTVSACPLCGREPTAQRPPMALDTGTLLAGRYQLGDVIGQGGFGITYAAWDETLGMPVAVKEYFPRDEAARNTDESDDLIPMPGKEAVFADGLSRFRRESNLLASLQGIPCVVKVLDYFSENGTAYIVMEFVHGKPIDQWAKENKLKPVELLDKLRPVFDALVRTHSQGVIHRDITPDNLLVEEDGSFKLIDFGSAVEVSRSAGTIVLTRRYAPVEQYNRDFGQQGPWTDVYGLAAVLYAIFSGEEPLEAPLRAHHDEQKSLARLHTGLKHSQAAAIDAALTVTPEKRTQSMAELRARLYNLPLPEEVLRRKRFMNRVIAVAAVLMVILALVALNFTTGLPIGNGLIGSFRSNGVYIINHLREEEEPNIPESVLGVPVTSINQNAFRGDSVLKKVEIPGTVKEIGDSTFYGCSNLEEVILAEGVESIGLSAFGACTQLISLTVPETVTDIGEGAITADAQLLTVWGRRNTATERYADEHKLRFADESELKWKITNGEAMITAVETEAVRLTLPNHIEGKPVTAMEEGIALLQQQEVWLPEYLKAVPANLFYANKQNNPYLSCVRLGPYIKEIGSYAFYGSSLPEIALPDSLEIICDHAFVRNHFSKLELPDGLRIIGDYAFMSLMVEKLVIPNSVETIGQGAFNNTQALKTIELPSSIQTLSASSFSSTGLTTIILPDSISTIGSDAFAFSSLQWIVLPESMKSIGSLAFFQCTSLRYVQIPASVEQINDNAFDGIPDDLIIAGYSGTYAETYARRNGIYFEDIAQWTAPDSLIGSTAEYSFNRNEEIIRVPIYNNDSNCPVTSCILKDNHYVKEIVLSPFQTEIGGGDFSADSSLVRVCTRGKIISIGMGAFRDCTALEAAPLSDIVNIPYGAFSNCDSLRIISFPDSLHQIESWAFDHCDRLVCAVFPNHLVDLQSSAFADCAHLQLVIFKGGRGSCDGYAFSNCPALNTVYYGEAVPLLDLLWLKECKSVTDVWVYNPEAEMRYTNSRDHGNLTIHGYTGSTSEIWAEQCGAHFETIPDGEPMPDPEDIIAAFDFYE